MSSLEIQPKHRRDSPRPRSAEHGSETSEPVQSVQSERPFGELQSSEEPRDVEQRRAREDGGGE